MATPLRLLTTPKYKLLQFSPVRKVKSCGNLTSTPENPSVKNHTSARRLDFTKTSANLKRTDEFSRKIPAIQINGISENEECKKCFAINTPEKRKLLTCGLQDRKTFAVIGVGSFGTVIKANYKGAKVAVKIIKSEFSSEVPEVNLLGLEHKNIIKTFDVIFGNNYTYCLIIMEYFQNTVALSYVLENSSKNITLELAIKIAQDVSEGLSYLHLNKLMHLDIKPANVLVCPDGTCKLCDFGSCMKVSNSQDEINYTHKGTVIYTAPEILQGKPPTFKSDVYSLGILMWQLITRRSPYHNIDCNEILIYKVVKYKLRPDTTKCERNPYTQLFCECWEENSFARPEVSVVIKKLKEIPLHQ